MKPFLILQLRPEDEAADGEYHAFLDKGGLDPDRVHRIRLDQQEMPEDLDLTAYAGVIVGGGPGCVSDPASTKPAVEARIEASILKLMPQITEGDLPFMGCCYGIGILAHHLGAPVTKNHYGEPVSATSCIVTPNGASDPLLAGLPQEFFALVGHKEAADALPEGCVHLVEGARCPMQMIRYGQNVYATQFHPEADGQIFADRIRIYKDRGYFPPETADQLTQEVMIHDISVPPEILRRFVKIYG